MKYFIQLFVVSFLSPALAGTEGHGGGGYLCSTGAEQVEVILVDLWEADLRIHTKNSNYNYNPIPLSNESIKTQVEEAVKRLASVNNSFAEKVKEELLYIERTYDPIPKGVKIETPTDVLAYLIPADCALVGVATYVDDSWSQQANLWIDMFYFKNMRSRTDQAALFLHEAIYKVLRNKFSDLSDSISTRKIVGILFSNPKDYLNDRIYLKQLLQ